MKAIGRTAAALLAVILCGDRAAAQAVDAKGFYTDPFLVLDVGTHTAVIKAMAADRDGRFLVTGSDDKTLRVWSANDGSLLNTIHIPAGPGDLGKIYAVALSPDGTTIAAGGWTGATAGSDAIYLFDRRTGEELAQRADLPQVVDGLAFSSDGTRLAATLGGTGGIKLFALPSLSLIASDSSYGGGSYGVAFAKDGRIATTSYDGKIRSYDRQLKLLCPPRPAPDGVRPFHIAFSPDGKRLAIGYDDTTQVSVVDSRTLLASATKPDSAGVKNGDLARVAWSVDGSTLYAGGRWQSWNSSGNGAWKYPIRAWNDAGSGTARDLPASDNTVEAIIPLADGRIAVAASDPVVLQMDSSGHIVWQVNPIQADFRNAGEGFRLSDDGTLVEFGFKAFASDPIQFNVHTLKFEPLSRPNSALRPPRTTGLDIVWENTEAPTLGGRKLPIGTSDTSLSLAEAADSNSFILGTRFSLRRFDRAGKQLWVEQIPGEAWAVNMSGDGRLAVAAYADGTIRWYRMDDHAELLALFPLKDGKRWVAWTPQGYYAASPGAEDLIKWQINREPGHAPEVYSASRFRDKFYRPDVIERVLDTLDVQKALDAADQAAGRRTVPQSVAALVDETPPRVAIIDPAPKQYIEGDSLDVTYTIEDEPGTKIRRVRLLQGGLLGAEDHNLTIPASGRLSGTLHVSLQGENPTLTLMAASAKGESDLATVQIRHPAAAPDDYKPILYVVAVGVSRFKNNDGLNLHYAAEDAHAVAERLRLQKGKLYRDVQVQELESPAQNPGDPEATRDNIMHALQWLERKVSGKDVAVLFFSTHGENDGNGDFFLLPNDVDPSDEIAMVDTSVQGPDIVRRVKRMAEHGKVLLFLDACHSGSIFKAARLDIDKFAQTLGSAQSGAIVFTSSSGTEFSREPPDLSHGILTQAFLEALDGKADAASRYLSVDTLQTWFEKEVVSLSNGAQHPKTYTPGPNFTNPTVFVATAAP